MALKWISKLSKTHEFEDSFVEQDRQGSTRRGDAPIGVSAEIMRAARRTEIAKHRRACAMSISLKSHGTAHVTCRSTLGGS